MEIFGRLQCNAFQRRAKMHRRGNNGYQWKSNAKNNGTTNRKASDDDGRLRRRVMAPSVRFAPMKKSLV
jgi:hypothetical protein